MGVPITVGVGVGGGVPIIVDVCDGVAMMVGVGIAVMVAVGSAVVVSVGIAVAVTVGITVIVALGIAVVGVGARLVSSSPQPRSASRQSRMARSQSHKPRPIGSRRSRSASLPRPSHRGRRCACCPPAQVG